MKLTVFVPLAWMLLSSAEALWCLHQDGDQSFAKNKHCDSADMQCATIAGKVYERNYQHSMSSKRACMSSSVCAPRILTSLHFGVMRFVAVARCCNTNGCNNQHISVPENGEPNGLQCFTCSDHERRVCNVTTQCVGIENSCITMAENNHLSIHGCASASLCDIFSGMKNGRVANDLFNTRITEVKCCGTSLCNSALSVRLSVFPLLLGLVALFVH